MNGAPTAATARRCLAGLVAVLLAGAAPAEELFQAWVPPRGEAFLSFDYSNAFVRTHLSAAGQAFDAGHIRTNEIGLQVGYSLTARLALAVGLPYRLIKYDGPYPHSPIDDGAYHGTFQDFHLVLRYQILREPVAVTTLAGATLPSHDYTYFAHAAAGNDLREYPLGLYLGRHLDPVLPNAWVQARYMYTFATPVLGIHHNRSNLDLEAGAYVAPSVALRALAAWQHTYGGLDLPADLTQPGIWPHQIARENSWDIGGGVIYQIGGAVDLTASYFVTAGGANTMKVRQGLTIGVAWNFSPSRLLRRRGGRGSP